MTAKELTAIRKRWEATMPGSWSPLTFIGTPGEADLDFMVHAHQDIPALLEHIAGLEKELENVRYDLYHNQPR